MLDHYYNHKLYPLQDKVMELIGHTNTDFYLTGGTVLGRYLMHHRYSDDLDFFVNADASFLQKAELAIQPVKQYFSDVELSTKQEHYCRYFVVVDEVRLKIEFVNDVRLM